MPDNIQQLQKTYEFTRVNNFRLPIVLSGEQRWLKSKLEQIKLALGIVEYQVVTDKTDLFSSAISQSQFKRLLGTECNCLVFDAYETLNPDALGATSGVVRGGGVFFLLVPEFSEWQMRPDQFVHALHGPPNENRSPSNHFIQRFTKLLHQDPKAVIVEQGIGDEQFHFPRLNHKLNNKQAVSFKSQQDTIEAIEHVVHGHRRRPLVVTADRGRGKSAALGLAAAGLINKGLSKIVITAPQRASVDTLFKHATLALQDADKSGNYISLGDSEIHFIAPDQLCREEVECGLLLVDEAGAIPTAILETLARKYSRVVFSTTVHGYEGNGRGFAVRFLSKLNDICPGWQEIKLHQPMRWAENDPLEELINRVLLLDAEPPGIAQFSPQSCSIELLESKGVVGDENLLKQVFGLLVLAHYQTRPSDLRFLLDAPQLKIGVVRQQGVLLAACIIALEGELPEELAKPIYQGERRVKGQVLPQLMTQYVADEQSVFDRYARIIRIAVLPELQGRKIGSSLLSFVEKEMGKLNIDYLGVNFGASPRLISFWHKAGLVPLRLGIKKETATGERAVMMVKAVCEDKKKRLIGWQQRFTTRFLSMQREVYQDVDAEIVIACCRYKSDSKLSLDSLDRKELWEFALGNRGYEVTSYLLAQLVSHYFSSNVSSALSLEENKLLVNKVLQGQNWNYICDRFGYQGKAEALRMLQSTTKKVVKTLNVDFSG